ncbi:hypothetical protein GCM10023149_43090 [Mucilaginibacter gynuensis]|uniref:Uncharacterized protein n=1 Tax=Mucilaginibacter gynuensis TaxID=1302236 RepID=A0ABP8H7K4_9SPHI
MPKYFDITLIAEQFEKSQTVIGDCLNSLGIYHGIKDETYFKGKIILFNYIENETLSFDEICISIEDLVFHQETFKYEIGMLTSLVTSVINCIEEVQFALCSYELNGYLLSEINKIEDINDTLLSKFPIVYKHDRYSKSIDMSINYTAQNLI